MRARRQDAMGDHRDHRGAARQHPDPRLPRDVVRPEHEAGEPRLRITRTGGELVGIEHRARGLDHRPHLDRGICAQFSEQRANRGEIVDG